jgi:hypothetical protein
VGWASTVSAEGQEFMVLRMLRVLSGLFIGSESRLAGEFCRLQEQLGHDYFEVCSSAGKPRGLIWDRCDWLAEAVLLRERTSGRWWMLRGVNLSFRAIEGGDMEDVAAVGLLRDACAVYEYEQGCWRPTGRTLFNMDTVRAAGHLAETHEQRLVFRIVAGRVVR